MPRVSIWVVGSLLVISCTRCLDGLCYQDNTALNTNSPPIEAKTVDLNGDNALDLIVTSAGVSAGFEQPGINSSVEIFFNLGDGLFGEPQTLFLDNSNAGDFIVAHNFLSTTAGDIDRDGDLDLVVGGLSSFFFSIFFQQGGSFVQGATVPLSEGILTPLSAVELFDINTDGALDILAIDNFGVGDPVAFLGDGQGSFGAGSFLPETSLCLFPDVRCADFNKDGNQDLVSGLSADAFFDTEARVGIFFAQEDGTFAAPFEIPSLLDFASFFNPDGENFSGRGDVGIGDFDGDNDLDLVVVHPMSDGSERDTFREFAVVTFLQNTGDNTFLSPRILFQTQPRPFIDDGFLISVDDLNLDGRPELLLVREDDDQVNILRDTGRGLQKEASLRLGDFLGRPSTADLNGDGTLDIITLQRSPSLVHLSLSKP